MTIKLDMSKAHDYVEWVYIEKVLLALGFKDHWIIIDMSCITSLNYSILVNERPGEVIIPTRGLRQGDSLSLYRFLTYAKGWSVLINQTEHNGDIQGFSMTKGGISISYLFFC